MPNHRKKSGSRIAGELFRFVVVAIFLVLNAPPASCGTFAPQHSERILVLHSGRVIEGPFIPRTDGYVIPHSAGQSFIPKEAVLIEAISTQAAWQQIRRQRTNPGVDDHLRLARWCRSQGLWDASRRELLDALRLDPAHSGAKSLLRQLARDEAASANTAQQPSAHNSATHFGTNRPGMLGVPTGSVAEFTLNIEPLISSRCGNAQCHGAGLHPFRWHVLRLPSEPVTTEKNLREILRYIDPADPPASPILSKAVVAHGGLTEAPLSSRLGAQQAHRLIDWVLKTGPYSDGSAVRHRITPDRLHETAENVVPAAFSLDPSETEDREQWARAVKQATPDPFSPTRFGERIHGRNHSSGQRSPNTN